MAGPGQDEYLVSRRYSWYVFTLLFLLYMFDYLDRLVIVSLFPFLQAEWGISDTQCGLLVSAVYWSITLFTFPVSILIDRWSRKKSIGLMALLWSFATGACAFAGSYRHLFVARSAIGLGEAGYAPGGTAMLAALFPERLRSRALGIWNASIPLGSALGIAVGGIVAEMWGWRHAFGLVAIPGAAIAILFFFVRDYKTVRIENTLNVAADGAKRTGRKAGDVARRFLQTPSLIFSYFGFAFNVFVTTSLLSWLPTFFHRTEGLPMSQAGLKGSSVMLMAVIGAPLGGFLTDRWRKRNPKARMDFPAISSAVTAVLLLVVFNVPLGAFMYPVFLLAGVSAIAFLPGAAAVTQDVVHPGLRAIAYSWCVIVQNLLGSSLGPLWVGHLSDKHGIDTALGTLPLFLFGASVMFWIGSRFYLADAAKVEHVELEFE